MKKQKTLFRDGLGRFNGAEYLWNYEEHESWKDEKCKDVKFPDHHENRIYPVVTYSIEELALHN